jgi:hypothetical protein
VYTLNILNTNISFVNGKFLTISTKVMSTIDSDISVNTNSNGTFFTLVTPGVYIIDYETSLQNGGAIALYSGSQTNNLQIINDSISGSSTAQTWIHGRYAINTSNQTIIALSSVNSPISITTAGNVINIFMVRISIMKIS